MGFFRVFLKTVKILFIVFLLFAAYTVFRPVTLPQCFVKYLCDKYTPQNYVAKCAKMRYCLLDGIVVDEVKLFDSSRKELLKPMYSMRDFSYNPITRHIKVHSPKFLRLADSYYSSLCVERDRDINLNLPLIKKHSFELIAPEILGLSPGTVSGAFEITDTKVLLSDITITWIRAGEEVALKGNVEVDMTANTLQGRVEGRSAVEYIRPFLVALDVPVAVESMGYQLLATLCFPIFLSLCP